MGARRAPAQAQGVTLDAGALIALEKGDGRMTALLRRTLAERSTFHVPAGVVGQVWRNGARQAVLARFLKSREVEIHRLDEHAAKACGTLCDAAGTSDVIDASVVLTAWAHGGVIVTSDPEDMLRLDAEVSVERI